MIITKIHNLTLTNVRLNFICDICIDIIVNIYSYLIVCEECLELLFMDECMY